MFNCLLVLLNIFKIHIPVNLAWTEEDFGRTKKKKKRFHLLIILQSTHATELHETQTSVCLQMWLSKIYVIEIQDAIFTAKICWHTSTDLRSTR